jgi:hydrogenase maturation protein HypF
VIAHDLHPDSIAASFARSRKGRLVAVQHHHAHVASAMAEHGIDGPVIGVAWDGTGFGPDGTLWGGEILLATAGDFQRLATLRPVPLAGGEKAIRDIWRIALAALDDAFDGAPPLDRLPLFAGISSGEIGAVRQMIARGFNAPLARGVGRWFDLAGAIGLSRPSVSYEGQAALEWNNAAGSAPGGAYPHEVDRAGPVPELDLRPALRALARDAIAGRPAPLIAASFHDTLAEAAAALVRATGLRLPVVLTGGCFQNARLAESLRGRLVPEFEVLLHRDVPCGDGGLALGQAVIAAAQCSA